ncbi:hypothetical protein F66182_12480, partial [Fusarium sp. NRRL 66182]
MDEKIASQSILPSQTQEKGIQDNGDEEQTNHEATSPTDKSNPNSSSSSSDEMIIDDDEARKTLDYDANDSPYPEVRAVVPAKDDPATPTNTVR